MPTMTQDEKPQRIRRLAPLADVLARIDAAVMPVEAQRLPLAEAENRALAEGAIVTSRIPSSARALRDGYAVRSEMTADASSYAPGVFAQPPVRVDVGEALPADADAVAPLDAIAERDGGWEVMAPVAPGEGVLPAGADIGANTLLLRKGERLRTVDMVALIAAGLKEVRVRVPRLRVMRAKTDPVLEACYGLVVRGVEAAGGRITSETPAPDHSIEKAFGELAADALIVIGGTGSGREDASVRVLAKNGEVAAHGIAISPGETAALGFIGRKPVLLVPGRVDAALAVWLLLGRQIVDRLSGCIENPPFTKAMLARKVASSLGLAEVVPVRLRDGEAESIASGYLPLFVLAQADGWILIPPESEGYPPGTEVMIRPWP